MNLKNKVLALGILCALGLPQAAGAEGFAINEWSAEGVAMGGARMFAEGDAANVAYNPASITKVDGEAFKVSATYLSPHGEYDLYDKNGYFVESGHNRVHFGFAPGTYYVKKLMTKTGSELVLSAALPWCPNLNAIQEFLQTLLFPVWMA